MAVVNQWKWVNQFQPQTLYMATILCYVDAVFGLLFGGIALWNLLIVGCLGAGAFGIANEKKWGYWLGLSLTLVEVLYLLLHIWYGSVITLLFYIALAALLLHPESRSYRRTWFR